MYVVPLLWRCGGIPSVVGISSCGCSLKRHLIASHSKIMALSVRHKQTGVNFFSNTPAESLTLRLFFVVDWTLNYLQEMPKHASRQKKYHLTSRDQLFHVNVPFTTCTIESFHL